MIRKSVATAAMCALMASDVSMRGQSRGDTASADDLAEVCSAYSGAELVFVGRPDSPITYRFSGEREIEQARRNLIAVQAQVKWLRDTLDPQTRWEREGELELRVMAAQAELSQRQAMYPPPYDLTLVPVRVERAIRGVAEATLMVHLLDPAITMEPGEGYLVSGVRSNGLIPPLPEMYDAVDVAEYVDALDVTRVDAAQRELRLLSSSVSRTTIVGALQMHSPGGGTGAPLTGVRIVASSGTHVVEAVTDEDGRFIVAGIAPGRVHIGPVLPEDLTVVNRSSLALDIGENGCKTVTLTAAPNGRVRGRIMSATGEPLAGVELVLQGVDPREAGRRALGSHSPRTTVVPTADGTFEFSGQFPGHYILLARLAAVQNGTARRVTYYPGTPDLEAAWPIVIEGPTLQDGFDFFLRPE